jgi:hypothetical protein
MNPVLLSPLAVTSSRLQPHVWPMALYLLVLPSLRITAMERMTFLFASPELVCIH